MYSCIGGYREKGKESEMRFRSKVNACAKHTVDSLNVTRTT